MEPGDRSVKRRRRARLACQECRDRKIRCDGATPLCDSCMRKNVDPRRCVYPDAEKSLTSGNRNIHSRQDDIGVDPPQSRLRQDATYGDLGVQGHYRTVPNEPLSPWHERRLSQRISSTGLGDQQDTSRNTGPSAVAETVDSSATGQSASALRESRRQTLTEWQPLSSPTHSEQHQQRFSYIANGNRGNGVSHSTIETENGEQEYEEISPRVVGSSSAFGFIENVHEALRRPAKRRVDSLQSREIYDTVHHFGASFRSNGSRRPLQTMSTSVADLSLPPRSVVDHLLAKYWDEIHTMNPILHEQTFMKRYNRLLSEGPTTRPSRTGSLIEVELLPSDRIFQATLNLVLAIVYLRASPGTSNDHDTTQETFFDRAERLLSLDLMQLESLQLVQALVLKAGYLREADMSNRSWIAVGIAIRTAQAIGLYVESNKGSQAEREQRRRVWYACVAMDRTQSMTYGRPPMITGVSTVSHPEAIDDEYLSIDPTERDRIPPSGTPSRMEFFVHTLRLSDIASRIRQLLYGPRKEPNVAERCRTPPYAEIIELDADLGKWHDQVPAYLHDEDSTPNRHRNCFIRQRINLRCQFLHWRLILFRGLLVDFARESSSGLHDLTQTPLQSILSRGCVEICIRAAQGLLDTIEPHLGTDRLPAGWFIASFFLYNIGAIIALALLSPGLRSLFNDLTLQDLRQAWWQCMNCLKKCHRLGVRFAQGCILRLRKMFEENEDGENGQAMRLNSEVPTTDGGNAHGIASNGEQPAVNRDNISHIESFYYGDPQDTILGAQNGMVDMWWTNQDLQWMNNFDLSHLESNVELPELREFF